MEDFEDKDPGPQPLEEFLDPSDEDILLYSAEVGPRIFIMNNSELSTILGIMIDESDDSFLVALPSRVVDRDGTKVVIPVVEADFVRMVKSSVTMVLFPFSSFSEVYLEYVTQMAKENEAYEEYLDMFKAYLENTEDPTPTKEPACKVQGLSNSDLAKYLASKK